MPGTVKQTLPFDTPNEGQPILLDSNGSHLAVATSAGFVRIFRLTGREVRPHAGPGLLLPAGGCSIDSICVNANGSMVVATARQYSSGGAASSGGSVNSSGTAEAQSCASDGRLYLYCSETNAVSGYDFRVDGRVPLRAAWDANEPRLLSVQVGPAPQSSRSTRDDPTGTSSQVGTAATAARSGSARPGSRPMTHHQQQQQQQQQLQPPRTAGSAPTPFSASRPATAGGERRGGGGGMANGSGSGAGTEVALLFACASNGLLLQEYQEVSAAATAASDGGSTGGDGGGGGGEVVRGRRGGRSGAVGFMGSCVPHLIMVRPGAGASQGCLLKLPIQGFAGLEVRCVWLDCVGSVSRGSARRTLNDSAATASTNLHQHLLPPNPANQRDL